MGWSRSPTAITLGPWSLMGPLGRGRPSPEGVKQIERRWAPPARGQPWPHLDQVPHGLSEAHRVHGHTHGVGESKNEADGAPQLWAKAPGDEEVGATYRDRARSHEPCGVSWLGWQKRWLGEGTTGARGPRRRKYPRPPRGCAELAPNPPLEPEGAASGAPVGVGGGTWFRDHSQGEDWGSTRGGGWGKAVVGWGR